MPETRFYVTMRKGEKTAWLLGPYETHAEALELVGKAAMLADDVSPGSWFNEFGTASITGITFPEGKLNSFLK